MRSKRDRRPLLSHDVPILSDEMPLDPGEGEIGNQLSDQGRKKSWKKRMFGKGSGAKRRQNENLRVASNGERDGNNIDLRPTEYSAESMVMNPPVPGKLHQERPLPHSPINKRYSNSSHQSSGVTDKRDDTIDLSQNIYNANKQVSATNTKKDIPAPSSTKSQNSSRSRSRSRSFMRSLKKKSSQDLASLDTNSPDASQQTKGEFQYGTSPSKTFSKQSQAKNHSQQKKNKSSSSTQLSPVSMKAAGPRYDVKKVLSKPFGREHILMTEQTVSFEILCHVYSWFHIAYRHS